MTPARAQSTPRRGGFVADRGPGQRPRPGRSPPPAWSPAAGDDQARRPSSATAPRPTRSPRKTRRGCARCGSRSLNHLTKPGRPVTLNGTTSKSARPGSSSTTSPRPPPAAADLVRRLRPDHLDRHLAGHGKRRKGRDREHPLALERLARPEQRHARRSRSTTQPGEPLPALGSPAAAPATFSGITDADGCAIFPDLPERQLHVTVRGEARGWSTKTAKRRRNKPSASAPSDTKTVNLEFDNRGRSRSTSNTGSAAARIQTGDRRLGRRLQHGHDRRRRSSGPPGGTREATVNATPLFPFTSAYSSTPAPAPRTTRTRRQNPAGGRQRRRPGRRHRGAGDDPAAGARTDREKQRRRSTGAKVTITDKVCKDESECVKRTYTINATRLPSSDRRRSPNRACRGAPTTSAPGRPPGTTHRKAQQRHRPEPDQRTTADDRPRLRHPSGACP